MILCNLYDAALRASGPPGVRAALLHLHDRIPASQQAPPKSHLAALQAGLMNPGPIHGLLVILIAIQREVPIMAGAKEKTVIQESTIEEIELEVSEIKELDQLAEETRKRGISWEDLKAELGL